MGRLREQVTSVDLDVDQGRRIYLASAAAAYANGSVIIVDVGWMGR